MNDILQLVKEYEKNYTQTINLVASENIMSNNARFALQADITHRYCIPPEDRRPKEIWEYPNQTILRKIEEKTLLYARQIYHGDYADVRPLSGNNLAYIIIKGLAKYKNFNSPLVLSVPPNCGGHFTTPVICKAEQIENRHLPYNNKTGRINIDSLYKLSKEIKPSLIFLDASMIVFPYPLKEIRDIFGNKVVISYDASHTLGIIAGGKFQDPLNEGTNIIHGSTHKSLFGPQKGLIVCKKNNEIANLLHNIITPLFVSNMHIHHVAALGIALEEIISFGGKYAQQVINNARSFAKYITQHIAHPNIKILFGNYNYTENHQLICKIGNKQEALFFASNLEKVGINLNVISLPFIEGYGFRIGFSEVTRRGFKEYEMEKIAQIFIDVINQRDMYSIKKEVTQISQLFNKTEYTF